MRCLDCALGSIFYLYVSSPFWANHFDNILNGIAETSMSSEDESWCLRAGKILFFLRLLYRLLHCFVAWIDVYAFLMAFLSCLLYLVIVSSVCSSKLYGRLNRGSMHCQWLELEDRVEQSAVCNILMRIRTCLALLHLLDFYFYF